MAVAGTDGLKEFIFFPKYDDAFLSADPKPVLAPPGTHWIQTKTLEEKKDFFRNFNAHRVLVNLAAEGESHEAFRELRWLWRTAKRKAHRRNSKRKRPEDENEDEN